MKIIKIEDIDSLPEEQVATLLKYLVSQGIEFNIYDLVYIGD